MSVGSDLQSGSQLLSSSTGSLNQSSKRASSEISKVYKHASQLFLTRRLAESYEALQPVISPSGKSRPDDSPALAPIALASTSQRIKIWSLYVTLLNSIVELPPDEGKALFGYKEFKELVKSVHDGDVWEQVVRDGYHGREDSVDAEVVYNLSNLLLGQAPNQNLTQSRLETYLASSSGGDLDFSNHLSNALSNGKQSLNGTSTPKDLNSRIKIMEIFTLHVLPRNEEWDYAKSFIANSDILDEERREAFLQTLQELQEAKEQEDEYEEAEEQVFEDPEEEKPEPSSETEPAKDLQPQRQSGHQRTSSEVDYGIESTHPNGTHTALKPNLSPTPSGKPRSGRDEPLVELPPKPEPDPKPIQSLSRTHLSPPAQTPRRPGRRPKSTQQNTLLTHARQLFLALSNLTRNVAGTLTGNPSALLRFLLFLAAFLMAFSQKVVRERVQRLLEKSWAKMRQTVGMGVKVSYI